MSEKMLASNDEVNGSRLREQVEVDYLEVAKQELKEMSQTEGKLIDLGTLSGGSKEHLWNKDGISLKRRKKNGELTQEEEDEAISALPDYFVPTSQGAAKRCVDGSTIEGYDDTDPAWYGRGLGPQLQGGTADEAVAKRLLIGVPDTEEINHAQDMDMIARDRKSDYAEGDHTDVHANEEKSGCGAVDGQLRKLAMYNDSEAAENMENTATTIFGLAEMKPESGMFARLQQSALKLQQYPNYFLPAQKLLAKLQELNPNGVEKLTRPHAEISLTLNFVNGTTFHRDHYNARTNSKIQNFNLDVWDILEEYGQEGYALIIDAVATVMDLTDGSLRLFARVPTGESAEDKLLQAA